MTARSVPDTLARLREDPVFVEGIGPPLAQIWEDYGCDEASPGGEAADVRALIVEVLRLREKLPALLDIAEAAEKYIVELDTERVAEMHVFERQQRELRLRAHAADIRNALARLGGDT